jgi:hypothetical protein
MVQGVKKRRARRFEIPGGKGKYKKTGLLVLIKGFSAAYPVVNVSKGDTKKPGCSFYSRAFRQHTLW